jgi:formylglycine-generating enzyme required for sulfatase activity
VAAFREFMEESGHAIDDKISFERSNTSQDHPVVKVNWHEALAYAEQYGFGLPSEAEEEKAARGTDGRKYPWGNEWRQGFANTAEYWSSGGRRFLRWEREHGETTPVGQFSPQGDSPYGCVDMTGNVWEWMRSLWGEDFKSQARVYPYDSSDGRENLKAPAQVLRVLRGGSFFNGSWDARCAFRYWFEPGFRSVNIGFRVVLQHPFSSNP